MFHYPFNGRRALREDYKRHVHLSVCSSPLLFPFLHSVSLDPFTLRRPLPK